MHELIFESIVAAVAFDSKISAAWIGGSFARKQQDQFSDIDICLLWKNAPSLEERKLFISRLSPESEIYQAGACEGIAGVSDTARFCKFKVDFHSICASDLIFTLEQFEQIPALSPDLSLLFFCTQKAKFIKTTPELELLLPRLTSPTPVQKLAAVKRYSSSKEKLIALHAALCREDLFFENYILTELFSELYFCSSTLLGHFWPGLKRSDFYLSSFGIDQYFPQIKEFWVMQSDVRVQFLNASFKTLEKLNSLGDTQCVL